MVLSQAEEVWTGGGRAAQERISTWHCRLLAEVSNASPFDICLSDACFTNKNQLQMSCVDSRWTLDLTSFQSRSDLTFLMVGLGGLTRRPPEGQLLFSEAVPRTVFGRLQEVQNASARWSTKSNT